MVTAVILVSLTALGAGYLWRQLFVESQDPMHHINYLRNFENDWRVLNADPVRVDDWVDKVLLFNFWGSWCPPCVEEMPLLDRFNATHDAIKIIGIVVDQESAATDFLSQFEIDFPSLLLNQSIVTSMLEKYGNADMVLPYSVAFGKSGELFFTKVGPLDEEELRRLIE